MTAIVQEQGANQDEAINEEDVQVSLGYISPFVSRPGKNTYTYHLPKPHKTLFMH